MRTLLFRGQGTDEKDRHTWYEGAYVRMDDTTYCFSEDYERAAAEGKDPRHYYIIIDCPGDWGLPNSHYKADIRPETLCQHTGKYDVNRKGIYENDIVAVYHESMRELCLIEYNSDAAAFVFAQGNFYRRFSDWVDDCIFEVVGNKFDTPELLAQIPQVTPPARFMSQIDKERVAIASRGSMLSSIRAFLDDRGHSWRYTFENGVLNLKIRCRSIRIWYCDGNYSVQENKDKAVSFASQRDVINNVIIPLLGNTYKEV